MARTKKVVIKEMGEVNEVNSEPTQTVPKILPITESFSIGELNVLRDKLNEVIMSL